MRKTKAYIYMYQYEEQNEFFTGTTCECVVYGDDWRAAQIEFLRSYDKPGLRVINVSEVNIEYPHI